MGKKRSLWGVLGAVAGCALVLSACGNEEGLLGGVGDLSRDFVYGDTTTTTTIILDVVDDTPIGAVKAIDVVWFNDGIPNQAFGEPAYVAARVWERAEGTNRFVQASRGEISAALPNVLFPELISDKVGWITSQLVYDAASGTLAADTSAAFGLWQVEPYTVDEGRVAVLRIGLAPPSAEPARSEVAADVVEDGLSLSWTEDGYRYELFCRVGLADEVCWQMSETMAPLRLQLGDSITPTEGTTDASG